MGRIRTIKPEFPQSESMGRVSRESRLCFILLFTLADDAGRLRGNSRMLASLLYPYDDDAKKHIDTWLSELHREKCIERYEIDGDSYVQLNNWLNHQKIDKPTASKIPPPPEIREDSRGLAEDSRKIALDQGEEGIKESIKGEEKRATRLPPDWQPDAELMAWATNERPDLNIVKTLESFRDHWKAAPGKSGTKMDWPATFRNWVRKERKAFQATPLAKTFAERDRDAKRAAWEARTGQKWPDDQPYTLEGIVTVVTTGENHVAAIKGH